MSHLAQWVPARQIGVSKVMSLGLFVGDFHPDYSIIESRKSSQILSLEYGTMFRNNNTTSWNIIPVPVASDPEMPSDQLRSSCHVGASAFVDRRT
jgi:hypothetical protein